MKRLITIFLVSLGLVVPLAPEANAVAKVGAQCTVSGKTTTANGKKLVCKKTGSKLAWQINRLPECPPSVIYDLKDLVKLHDKLYIPPQVTEKYIKELNLIYQQKLAMGEMVGAAQSQIKISGVVEAHQLSIANVSRIEQQFDNITSLCKADGVRITYRYVVPAELKAAEASAAARKEAAAAKEAQSAAAIAARKEAAEAERADAARAAIKAAADAKAAAEKALAEARKEAAIAEKAQSAYAIAETAAAELKAQQAALEKAAADEKAMAETAAAELKAQQVAIEKLAREKCSSGQGSCQIGYEGPGGGIVFFDAGIQQTWGRYLEFAPSGWYGSTEEPYPDWCDIIDIDFSNSTNDQNLKSVIGPEIGKGKANTNLMLSSCISGAAVVAHSYYGGEKNDWYLPSMDELNELFKYVKKYDPKGFLPYDYWSSSEAGRTAAWRQGFNIGNQFADRKEPGSLIRPVRAF